MLHKHFSNVINGDMFNSIMTLAVFLNTTVLAMDGLFDENPTALEYMALANSIFTFTFILELSCKLIAMGPVGNLTNFKIYKYKN